MSSGIPGRIARRPAGHRAISALAACLPLLLFPLSPVRAIEVYKWTDASGKVHYGDRPAGAGRRDQEQMEIDPDAPPPDPEQAVHEERSRKLLQEFEKDSRDKEARETTRKQQELKRKANCGTAEQRLDYYEHAGYIYDTGKDGERRILSDAEHAQVLERSRADVKKWCNPPEVNP